MYDIVLPFIPLNEDIYYGYLLSNLRDNHWLQDIKVTPYGCKTFKSLSMTIKTLSKFSFMFITLFTR